MPPRRAPAGIVKKTARKDTKKVRERAKRLEDINRLQSPLLRLPAELRNRIYEHALVEDRRILLSNSTREPSLLRVCRQIRSEALKIYYLDNTFKVKIHNCDARLLGRFIRHVEWIDEEDPVKLLITVKDEPNWGNLVAWCKEVYENECCEIVGLGKEGGGEHTSEVAAAATQIASEMEKVCSWEQCLKVIEKIRPVAAFQDQRWEGQ